MRPTTQRPANTDAQQKPAIVEIVSTKPPAPRAPRESTLAAWSARKVLGAAKTISAHCARCRHQQDLQTPIDLTDVRCSQCQAEWDLVEIRNGRPIHHGQMQQLIDLCYRSPAFAKTIVKRYARDHARALTQEWSIDKPLLACHAAQALAISGHRSALTFMSVPVGFAIPIGEAFLPPLGAILPIALAARGIGRGRQWAHRHVRRDHYDPAAVAASRMGVTQKIVDDLDLNESETLHFAGSFNPFESTGVDQGTWSILVDRRRRENGTTADDPASLDLAHLRKQVLDHLMGRSSDSAALTGLYFRTSETFVDSARVEASHKALLDDDLYPQPAPCKDASQLEELDVCRTYDRVTYYDRARNMSYTTLFRLANRGPFTQLEVVGSRTLPLAKKLFQRFDLGLDAQETRDRFRTPRWWFRISSFWRARTLFVAFTSLALLIAWAIASAIAMEEYWEAADPGAVALVNGPSMILLLLLVAATYGKRLRLENLYKSRLTWPWPFRLLQRRDERARQRKLNEIRLQKELGTFDYSPEHASLRVGQSKAAPTGYFESSSVQLIRQAHNLAIQDCFLHALQKAGIDTSDFREGAARINNYGVINSGDVKGSIVTSGESGQRSAKRQPQTATASK